MECLYCDSVAVRRRKLVRVRPHHRRPNPEPKRNQRHPLWHHPNPLQIPPVLAPRPHLPAHSPPARFHMEVL